MRKITALVFKLLIVAFLLVGVLGFGKFVRASDVIVQWNFPDDPDDEIADGGIESNLDKIISAEGVGNLSFNNSGKTTKSASSTGWDGNDEKFWQIAFSSIGYKNLSISSKQKSSGTGPRDFSVQYRIGDNGEWIDVDGGEFTMINSSTWNVIEGIALSSDCDDQESVYVRWIKISDFAVAPDEFGNESKVGPRGSSSIDDIIIEGELIESGTDEGEENECIKSSFDVKINEIFPDPGSGKEEFVELKNFGESCADLTQLKIKDKGGKEYPLTGIVIAPNEIILFNNIIALNNDSEIVFLLDSSGNEIDSVSYDKAIENKSYSFDGESWFWSSNETPGEENKFDEVEEEDEFEGGNYAIRLNEILPNPKGEEEKGEFIEIYNGESFALNLKDWILKDSSKNGKFVFPKEYEIKSGEYLTIYRDVFGFSLNNSGKESVYLLDPDENLISAASYESAKEDISYNFDGTKWVWSKHLTPGKENKFNSAPKVKLKKIESGYIGMPVYFEADVKSKDKDEIEYLWDFDDGGRSYLQNVNHTFKKEGKYKVKLTVDDGVTGIEKSFTIKIKKYPKASVEITRLLPNPEGNDTGEEWLEVKNNSAKEVNLKGWKIATGQENLINHSIADDLKIPSGATFQITREHALFFLNNKEAKLELRYPNGKTAAKLSYKKDKIKDDEICLNKGGVCSWIVPSDEDEKIEEEEEVKEEINNQEEDMEVFENFEGELSKIKFSEDFLKENIGKLSRKENEVLDKIYEIRLVKNGSENSLAVNLKNGKGFVYQLEDSYHFTPSLYQTHWAVDLLDDIKTNISLSLN